MLFIHEMTHVWQHQRGVNILAKAIYQREYTRRWFVVSLCLIGGCQALGTAQAWDEATRGAAVGALEDGDCDKVWRLVWGPAREGELDALLILAGAMYLHGLTPPGAGVDVLAQLRSTMSVYAQAARSGDERSIEILSALVGDDFFAEANGKSHAVCLLRGADAGSCIDAAIADGVISAYDQWISQIDAVGAAHAGGATCTRKLAPRNEELPQPSG